jgi:cysteine desulfurase
MIYLDWNATTPPHPEVLEVMREVSAWGNPSSTHRFGGLARAELERARHAVAELAGADVRDVLFTSGGTEANNLALVSAVHDFLAKHPGRVARIVTSELEHPSITECARAMARGEIGGLTAGQVEAVFVPLDRARCVPNLEALERTLAALPTAIVAVGTLNHETGVVMPTADVLTLARNAPPGGVPVLVDQVQGWGKREERWVEAAYRSFAAHKIRGPKGIGALITRPFAPLRRMLVGGAQERGLRAGTQDPTAARGLARAAQMALEMPARYRSLAERRDALEAALRDAWPSAHVIGAEVPRAPHVSCVVFPGVPSAELLAVLDVEGVSLSAGAACSAGTVEPSRVVKALAGDAAAASAVRISFGPDTPEDDLERAVAIFRRVLPRFS